jgi:hypothetical protein
MIYRKLLLLYQTARLVLFPTLMYILYVQHALEINTQTLNALLQPTEHVSIATMNVYLEHHMSLRHALHRQIEYVNNVALPVQMDNISIPPVQLPQILIVDHVLHVQWVILYRHNAQLIAIHNVHRAETHVMLINTNKPHVLYQQTEYVNHVQHVVRVHIKQETVHLHLILNV